MCSPGTVRASIGLFKSLTESPVETSITAIGREIGWQPISLLFQSTLFAHCSRADFCYSNAVFLVTCTRLYNPFRRSVGNVQHLNNPFSWLSGITANACGSSTVYPTLFFIPNQSNVFWCYVHSHWGNISITSSLNYAVDSIWTTV